MAQFTIQGRLPSANEFIRWDRIRGRHGMRVKFWGAAKRREARYHIFAYIRLAKLAKFSGQVALDVRWVEPNARRDYDNIASGIKFILDALVQSGIIKGDSRKWIPAPVQHHFAVDKKNPRIEVTIEEAHVYESRTTAPA